MQRWKDFIMMGGGSWNEIINGTSNYWISNDYYNYYEMTKGSKDLQKGIYYTLCACYALVAMVALVQLVRIQMRVPEYGWTTQKVFHFMNFIVNGLRAILFGLYKRVFQIRPRAFEVMLLDLLGLLFFSTYTLLVLFWAEIYHQARSLPTDSLRPAYYIANAVVYIIQIVIWIVMKLSGSPGALEATKLFLAVVSLVAALGFLIYGGRLFFMLRRFPIESRGRQKKLYEGNLQVLSYGCQVAEIVPSALVLFTLRKLPPKRVSDQYHAIQ